MDNKRLDLVSQPDGYLVWRDRALAHLAKDRPDVRSLLVWAEKQPERIAEATEAIGATQAQLREGPSSVRLVSYTLFDGIKHLLSDNLLGRARACGDGNGLELWRTLHSEWAGSAPQVLSAKSRRYQEPSRCSSAVALWDSLPSWTRLGEELMAAGLDVPGWVKTSALEKLVPDSMVTDLVGRSELNTFELKLAWVQRQMEHGRGAVQAVAMLKGQQGTKKDGDVLMAAMGIEDGKSSEQGSSCDSLIWSLHDEGARAVKSGDFDRLSQVPLAMQALAKGKSEGAL